MQTAWDAIQSPRKFVKKDSARSFEDYAFANFGSGRRKLVKTDSTNSDGAAAANFDPTHIVGGRRTWLDFWLCRSPKHRERELQQGPHLTSMRSYGHSTIMTCCLLAQWPTCSSQFHALMPYLHGMSCMRWWSPQCKVSHAHRQIIQMCKRSQLSNWGGQVSCGPVSNPVGLCSVREGRGSGDHHGHGSARHQGLAGAPAAAPGPRARPGRPRPPCLRPQHLRADHDWWEAASVTPSGHRLVFLDPSLLQEAVLQASWARSLMTRAFFADK